MLRMTSSCVFTRSSQSSPDGEGECRRSVSFSSPAYGKASGPTDLDTILPDYPKKVVKIASAVGLLPELQRLKELEKRATNEDDGLEVQKLQLHHQLLSHVVLIMLEVNSTIAEAQCEEARVNEIAHHLQKAEDSQTELLTLSSIIFSGVAAILSGVFTLTGDLIPDAVAAITGGGIGTTLGATALMDHTDYTLEHSRNILKEVWEGPETSKVFPPSVWRFLTSPHRDERTPREHLLAQWKNKVGISKEGTGDEAERASLLFSKGGTYELSDVRARATMLSMLASTIDLIQQDIEELMREILKRSNNEPPLRMSKASVVKGKA